MNIRVNSCLIFKMKISKKNFAKQKKMPRRIIVFRLFMRKKCIFFFLLAKEIKNFTVF